MVLLGIEMPTPVEYWPALHPVQLTVPITVVYVPAAHAVQTVALIPEKKPPVQLVQALVLAVAA